MNTHTHIKFIQRSSTPIIHREYTRIHPPMPQSHMRAGALTHARTHAYPVWCTHAISICLRLSL